MYMLKDNGVVSPWSVALVTKHMDLYELLSEESREEMKKIEPKADLKDWIKTWASVQPDAKQVNDAMSKRTFYAVRRVAVELLLQMRNSSCQERNFSLSASADHQCKYLSRTFDAVLIKSFAKHEKLFKGHQTEAEFNRHWLKNSMNYY